MINYKNVLEEKDIQLKYIGLCKQLNVDELSRDKFCSLGKISKSKIQKIFGSFSNFKESVKTYKNFLETYKFNEENTSSSNLSLDDEEEENEEYYNNPNYKVINKYLSYNLITKDYIFNFSTVRNIGRTYVLPETQIYAMMQLYSNFDDNPSTLTQIALKYTLPQYTVKKIFQVLNFTHDSLPITEELVNSKSEDEIVEDLSYQQKVSSIQGKYQQRKWENIQCNNNKWLDYENGVLNPFRDILETWQPPKLKYNKPIKSNKCNNNKSYIVTLSDLHFGSFANTEYTYLSKSKQNLSITEQSIKDYVNSILEDLSTRNESYNECILLSLGDILHSVSGYTDKGTHLESDITGPLQFKSALNTLFYLIDTLSKSFNKLEIKSVSGNHDYFADWALFTALEKTFSTYKNIKFDISMSRWMHFTKGKNLFILEHGYSPFYKSKVPKAMSAKESYIQRLILNALKEVKTDIKNKYFIMGDLHHHKQEDYPQFEFIQLPTCVKNDKYSDHLNLISRPKQLTFILDNDKGITQTISHFV